MTDQWLDQILLENGRYLGRPLVMAGPFAPETDRRAELPLMASPAGASVEGRLTPCREVDVGLVGLTVAGSDTRAAGVE